jgi:acetyl-CoA carboxylase biotin carboxyl carrier protein
MTGAHGGEEQRRPDTDVHAVLDAVRQAALDLLRSLPDRPERLRLAVAEVTVDLDWRVSAVPGYTASGPTPVAGGAQGEPPGDGQARTPLDRPADDRPQVLHYVCAPSVGTFYRAPEPGGAPFVTEGGTVKDGQQVAIVEAMKLMLPVEADRAGRVVEVLVEDGQGVEYGDRLLALAPLGAT